MAPHQSAAFAEEIRQVLVLAAKTQETYLASGQLEGALNLADLLAALYPGVPMFVENALRLSLALGQQERAATYRSELLRIARPTLAALDENAAAAFARHDFDEEIKLRTAIFRHPEDAHRPSVLRLQNINGLLSRILIGQIDEAKISLAKELVGVLPSIPPFREPTSDTDSHALFDRFWRLWMAHMDLNSVFGPPLAALSWPNVTFALANGEPVTLAGLADMAKTDRVEVAFFAATSVGYFKRYAKAYVSSILNACDCNCLVFVCISGGRGRLEELSASLGIDDRRIIFCTDEMDEEPKDYRVVPPSTLEPTTLPVAYYGSLGLLCLHAVLPALRVPIFNSGIDTVLQRGVRDLIDERRGSDVVLNLNQGALSMESRITNSLMLAYPTPNAQLFANFLSNYLGREQQNFVQPSFFDQFALLMAKLHVERNGQAPNLGYFGEFDTNNLMFKHKHARTHRDFIKQFRFVNIFSSCDVIEPAIRPDDLVEDLAHENNK